MRSNPLVILAFALIALCVISCDNHTHTYSDDWSSDDTYHWHATTCEHADAFKDKDRHVWNEGKVTIPATVNNAGVKTYTCTVCKKATKTEDISVCGDHKFSDWKDGEDGKHYRECSVCGFKEEKEHTYGSWAKKDSEKHSHLCTECSHEDEVAHTFGEWIADGTNEKHSCSVCDYEATREISKQDDTTIDTNWYTGNGDASDYTITASKLMPRRFTYDPVNDTSYSGDDTYNKEFGYYHADRSDLHLLLYPNDIYITYISNGGMGLERPDNAYYDAFFWYLYSYYDVTRADVAEMIDNNTYLTFVEKLNEDLKNGKKASAEDVPEGHKQIVSDALPDWLPTDAKTIELRAVYPYSGGNLIFEDNTPVVNLNMIYCAVEDWSSTEETRIVIYIYIPKTEIEAYEASRGRAWEGDNQPFYEYLKKRGLSHSNYNIPIDTLKTILNGEGETRSLLH